MFKNSYRSALTESSIFKHRDWDLLYPLVLIRLNTMITKYGMSRKVIQFGDVTEHNLPIVTDSVLYEPLEEELDEISKLFKARVGRFINKKKANKKYYKIGKDIKFNNHELVMYRVYNPSNLLADTFAGPARIIEIQPKGAIFFFFFFFQLFLLPQEMYLHHPGGFLLYIYSIYVQYYTALNRFYGSLP